MAGHDLVQVRKTILSCAKEAANTVNFPVNLHCYNCHVKDSSFHQLKTLQLCLLTHSTNLAEIVHITALLLGPIIHTS